MSHFIVTFLCWGYPSDHLKEVFLKACSFPRSDLLKYNDDNEQGNDALFLITDYCPGFPGLKPFITENWDLLKCSQGPKILGKNSVIFGYRRPKNLKDVLVRARFPTLTENKTTVPL